MARSVDFRDLDDAAKLVAKLDESYRAAWARRWTMKIDRTLVCARKFERHDSPAGLLAAAAVSLLEARELPEDDEGQWGWETKHLEASRLIKAALDSLGGPM